MYCPKCGTNVDDSFNFCFKCGFDFSVVNNGDDNDIKINSNNKSESLFNGIGKFAKSLVSDGEAKTKVAISVANDLISSTTKKLKRKYEFSAFDGSQESFEKIYCSLCYEQQDFDKLAGFIEYVQDEYSNININFNNALVDDVRIINIGKFLDKNGMMKSYAKLCLYADNLEDIVKFITSIINTAFYYKIIGERNYKFSVLNYQTNFDEDFDGLVYMSNSNAVLKVDNIANDVTKYITTYSEFGREVYCKILDNAIKLHHADYLNNMYPTKEQAVRVASLLKTELQMSYKESEKAISRLIQSSQECNKFIQLYSNLENEEEGWIETIVDNAISGFQIGVLFAMNPVLGGARAVQYGKQKYDKYKKESQRSDTIKDGLGNSFEEFIDGYVDCVGCLQTTYSKCQYALENNIARKYLLPAINNIFEALKANGINVLPIQRYLE